MIGEAISQELIAMEPETPWLKRLEEEPPEEPGIDYEVMLLENEYR